MPKQTGRSAHTILAYPTRSDARMSGMNQGVNGKASARPYERSRRSMDRDAIEVLTDEHDGLQNLFAQVSRKDVDRSAVLQELLHALALHVAVEKQMLVPVIKDRLPDGADRARQLRAYHDEIERVHLALDRRKVNSPDVPGLVTQLLDLTDAHIAEAEETVLPELRTALTEAELADLGAAMVSDERHLLTHPHPHLPDSGPLAGLARRAAGLVDHKRDKSADIGRTAS
jgi:hypothetical protein